MGLTRIKVLLLLLVLLVIPVAPSRDVVDESGVVVYVVPTMTSDKVLPTSVISGRLISDTIRVVASPGEYEAASFVVRSAEGIQSLQVETIDLVGAAGSIPSSNVDVKVVKCWWQSGVDVDDTTHRVLTPELLLYDDSLVRVENGENYLRMTDGEYRWISDPRPVSNDDYPYYSLIEDFPVRDSDTLQPVDISGGENKQFWVTVEVPEGTEPGIYDGAIQLRTSAGLMEEIGLELQVLGIDLLAPGLITSIAYHGFVASNPTIGPYRKSETQLRAELEDMLEHGVINPSLYEGWDMDALGTCLRIRSQLGMVGQALYLYCGYDGTGNSTDPAELDELSNKVADVVAFAESYGVTDVYIYGIDEAEGEMLASQRAAWDAVHEGGGKVWATSWAVDGLFESVGDMLDLARVGHEPDPGEAAKWHGAGHQIISYSNPQGGIEDPEVYRRNYGLVLWQADYDGGMMFAYNAGFGNTWNDFDDGEYRDHCMVYPTVNGEVDTIQWEGFREGVDDLRYLNTLVAVTEEVKANGGDTAVVEAWLAHLKGADLNSRDLDELRAEMAAHILSLNSVLRSNRPPPSASLCRS